MSSFFGRQDLNPRPSRLEQRSGYQWYILKTKRAQKKTEPSKRREDRTKFEPNQRFIENQGIFETKRTCSAVL